MKILITGKRTYGVAGALNKLYPGSTFISRNETGHDLCTREAQQDVAEIALEHDVFINCSALWRFNQTLLLQEVFKRCYEEKHAIHIINIGSRIYSKMIVSKLIQILNNTSIIVANLDTELIYL